MSMSNSTQLMVGIQRKLGLTTDEVEVYLLEKPKSQVVALGRLVLDYHWMTAPKEVQGRFSSSDSAV